MAQQWQTRESGGKYSAHSQRCLLQRDKLCATLADLNHQAEAIEKQIAAAAEEKERLGKAVLAGGGPYVQEQFKRECERVAERREALAICQMLRLKTQAEIDGLAPSLEEQKTRAEREEELARLASARLEKDRRAHNLLKDLRSLIAERVELTVRMAECATAINLTIGEDGLDAARFKELLAALPVGLADSSERLYARFLGKQKGLKRHIVRDDRLVLPETLASHGVNYFGEAVELTEEQGREFLREDGSTPPSIMGSGDLEVVIEEADRRGISTQEVCFWADVQHEVAARKREESQPRTVGGSRQNVAAHKGNGFVNDLRIRATVKSPLLRNGKLYQKGDSIDVVGKREAWDLVHSGLIRPPWEG